MEAHERRLFVSPTLIASAPEGEVFERIAAERNEYGHKLRHGICPACRGNVDGGIECHPRDADRFHYSGRCGRCGVRHGIWIGDYLLGHPAVVSFYWDRGVDVRSTPHWTLDLCVPGCERVVSTDPLRLRVDIEREDEQLSVTVDSDGKVATDRR